MLQCTRDAGWQYLDDGFAILAKGSFAIGIWMILMIGMVTNDGTAIVSVTGCNNVHANVVRF
jgi:hypothetical protein